MQSTQVEQISPGNPQRAGFKPQPLAAAQIDEALLTIKTVSAITALSSPTIYRRLATGDFPKPIRLSTRCTRWRAGDVRDWLNQQRAA